MRYGCGPSSAAWLQQRLDAEQSQRESVHRFEFGEAMSNPRVWLLTLVYFGQNVSGYGLLFFLPTDRQVVRRLDAHGSGW